MIVTKIDFDISVTALYQVLQTLPGIQFQRDHFTVKSMIPHAGYRFYTPQIIKGEVKTGNSQVSLFLYVRPTYIEIMLICFVSFFAVSCFFSLLLQKCDIYFCILVNLATLLYILKTFWQMHKCLRRLTEWITAKIKQ